MQYCKDILSFLVFWQNKWGDVGYMKLKFAHFLQRICGKIAFFFQPIFFFHFFHTELTHYSKFCNIFKKIYISYVFKSGTSLKCSYHFSSSISIVISMHPRPSLLKLDSKTKKEFNFFLPNFKVLENASHKKIFVVVGVYLIFHKQKFTFASGLIDFFSYRFN